MTWRVTDLPTAVEVAPNDDIIEHSHDLECACGPDVERIVTTKCRKMRVRLMITHHAMDGRES